MIGAGYVVASLRRHGFDVVFIDEPCYSFSRGAERTLRRLEQFGPDAVGFTLATSQYVYFAYEFLRMMKERMPGIPAVAGGLHATLISREVFAAGFDFGVAADGEEAAPALFRNISDPNISDPAAVDSIPGVSRRNPRGPHSVSDPSYIEDLDSIPFPVNRIFRPPPRGAPMLAITAARGCRRRCRFCAEYYLNRSLRRRSVENVMEEIRDALENHGVERIEFLDSSFLESRAYVEELCREIAALGGGSGFTWKAMVRADHLDPDILSTMKSCGCTNLYVGMESAGDDTLKKLNKHTTVADNEKAVALCRDAGVGLTGYFITGLPWETRSHYERSRRFHERHSKNLDDYYMVIIPFPGTDLYAEYHAEYGFTDWWMKTKLCAMAEPGYPLYRWLATRDPVLERDFFQYSNEEREMILYFLEENRKAAGQGMRGPLHRAGWGVLSVLSFIMFHISPRLEHSLMAPVYHFFHGAAVRRSGLVSASPPKGAGGSGADDTPRENRKPGAVHCE